MNFKIYIIIVVFSFWHVGCNSPYHERSYFIQDQFLDIEREVRKEPLPPAYGKSWKGYWENMYKRWDKYRLYDPKIVIYAVEMERRKKGLPAISISKYLNESTR